MESFDKLIQEYYYSDKPHPEKIMDYLYELYQKSLNNYIERPVDAEGIPWFLEEMTAEGDTVIGFEFDRLSKWNIIVYTPGAYTRTFLANKVYHYKNQTVETLLKDMLRAYDSEEDFNFHYWVDEFQNFIEKSSSKGGY